jgi:hypothetical protein
MNEKMRFRFLSFLKYISRVGVALSVLINVLLGGASNQTFSARNYERKIRGKINLVWLIDLIFFFDKNHCFMSWAFWKTTEKLREKKFYKNIINTHEREDILFYYAQE